MFFVDFFHDRSKAIRLLFFLNNKYICIQIIDTLQHGLAYLFYKEYLAIYIGIVYFSKYIAIFFSDYAHVSFLIFSISLFSVVEFPSQRRPAGLA